MEPRSFDHGNPEIERKIERGFNGATIFRPWKSQLVIADIPYNVGLQWSHDLSTMEIKKYRTIEELEQALQWSHDLSTMEIEVDQVSEPDSEDASMEPRSFDHGNQKNTFLKNRLYKASMEPRSFDHGNLMKEANKIVRKKLQWSHDLSTMEIGKIRLFEAIHRRASMEPRSFDHGNHVPLKQTP